MRRSAGATGCALPDRRRAGPVRGQSPRPRVAAGARVHGLPPAADGGGRGPRERGAGLGGAQLAAGPLVAAGKGTLRGYGPNVRQTRRSDCTRAQCPDSVEPYSGVI